jgi:hypothetical protein
MMNCSPASTDLFGDELRQEDIVAGFYDMINPVNAIDGGRTIEFVVKGSEDFIDLKHCSMLLKLRIKNIDNTVLADDKEIATINYPLASAFEHLEVYLNNDLVTNTADFGYKTYMETMFTFSPASKNTWLQMGGFAKDTHGQMDTLSNVNKGFGARKSLFAASKVVELVGKIHSDLFNQGKLLLNHVDLRLVFTRNKDDFCRWTLRQSNWRSSMRS